MADFVSEAGFGPCECLNSSYVNKCLANLPVSTGLDVLDIPSGFGRHSLFFAERGNRVVAVDIDANRLEASNSVWGEVCSSKGSHRIVHADIESTLDFDDESFDLILVIHYFSDTILDRVKQLVRVGGFVIFETFGAHGENWKDLPDFGWVRSQLPSFSFLDLHEKLLQREGNSKATVKFLAKRIT